MLVRPTDSAARSSALTDHLIRVTTAIAVVTVACVAAIISYQHAYELVSTPGERGLTARLLPFTVDGLIWAASMVVLDGSRRGLRVPPLAAWSLGVGIVATVGANLAHGLGHGPIGALVSAWPAVALVGSNVPTRERSVLDRHDAGHSQRAIARDLSIDRRKVKRIIGEAA
jgi:hypothetical protein